VTDETPVAAQFCATFLKPEMLHVYRQITALRRWRPAVITQKRENASAFPFPEVTLMPRPATRWIRRWWQLQVLGEPVRIYRGEARWLAREVARLRARVVHVYFGHIGVYLLPFLDIAPAPVVVSFHGADAGVGMDRPRHRELAAAMFARAAGVLVRSEALRAALEALGCPSEKIALHRTGIPLDAFPFSPRTFPSDGAWHFVQASRLIRKKGIAVALRAFAGFAKNRPAARFTVAGEGPMLAELRQLAGELGIGGRVEFPGFLDQPALAALYARAHAVVHPSVTPPDGDREGVPNALLEAMATGLPALATRHGGIPEAVADGVSGWLVPEGEAEALGAAMERLAADRAAWEAMGRAAADGVARDFELGRQAAALEGLYDRFSAGGRAAE
jgi:colanic acid/amylovoran biosynthesis glycosyltransferase